MTIGTDMLTDFVSGFLARRALSKREQKQNNVLLFWDKAQRAKKVVNISLPIVSNDRSLENISYFPLLKPCFFPVNSLYHHYFE